MPLSRFEELNERQLEAGLPVYANPRNTCAGSVRQKDPAVTASRGLQLWSYQLGEVVGGPVFPTHSEQLEWLGKIGFPINPNIRMFDTLAEVHVFTQGWLETPA